MDKKIQKAKEYAALGALKFIKSGQTLGIGSGSTVEIFVKKLANVINTGVLKNINVIPTSYQVLEILSDLEIPIRDTWEKINIDVTIDGADEIDNNFNIIKGGGAALLREKIIAYNSKKYIIIADYTKFTDRLCSKSLIPLEVLPFAAKFVLKKLSNFGYAEIRYAKNKVGPIITDNGNLIIDFRPSEDFLKKTNLRDLDLFLKSIPGILETGLFIEYADIIIKGLMNTYEIYNNVSTRRNKKILIA